MLCPFPNPFSLLISKISLHFVIELNYQLQSFNIVNFYSFLKRKCIKPKVVFSLLQFHMLQKDNQNDKKEASIQVKDFENIYCKF